MLAQQKLLPNASLKERTAHGIAVYTTLNSVGVTSDDVGDLMPNELLG